MSLHDLPEHDLESRCKEETSKFLRNDENDTQYCFELFRRLLEERQTHLLAPLIETYGEMMEKWTTSHAAFADSGLESNELVGSTFAKLIQNHSRENFKSFDSLAAILAWMKTVLTRSLIDFVRRDKQPPPNQLDDIGNHSIEAEQSAISSTIELEELWSCICHILDNEADISIAHYIFVQHLKPRTVAEEMELSARQISVRLYHIRQKLRDRIQECV